MAQGSVTQANQRGQSTLIALSNYRGPLLVAATVVGVVFVPVLYWVVERVVGGRGAAGEVQQRPAGVDSA